MGDVVWGNNSKVLTFFSPYDQRNPLNNMLPYKKYKVGFAIVANSFCAVNFVQFTTNEKSRLYDI